MLLLFYHRGVQGSSCPVAQWIPFPVDKKQSSPLLWKNRLFALPKAPLHNATASGARLHIALVHIKPWKSHRVYARIRHARVQAFQWINSYLMYRD